MSKKRSVDTHFWNDTYVSDLDPIEKVLFLYFLTNPLTNMLGVYEIPLRRIAFDTGIDKDMVNKIVSRFDRDKKISYVEGYIVLHNFLNHQRLNTNMKTSAKNEFLSLPDNVKASESLGRVRKALERLKILSSKELEAYSNNPKGDSDLERLSNGSEGLERLPEIESESEEEVESEMEGESARVNGCPIPAPLQQIDGLKKKYEFYCQYMKENHNRWPSGTTTEMDLQKLAELQEAGNDPIKVIEQTIQGRNKSFYPIRDFEKKEESADGWLERPNEAAYHNDYTGSMQ